MGNFSPMGGEAPLPYGQPFPYVRAAIGVPNRQPGSSRTRPMLIIIAGIMRTKFISDHLDYTTIPKNI
jgi:hypothetical protein